MSTETTPATSLLDDLREAMGDTWAGEAPVSADEAAAILQAVEAVLNPALAVENARLRTRVAELGEQIRRLEDDPTSAKAWAVEVCAEFGIEPDADYLAHRLSAIWSRLRDEHERRQAAELRRDDLLRRLNKARSERDRVRRMLAEHIDDCVEPECVRELAIARGLQPEPAAPPVLAPQTRVLDAKATYVIAGDEERWPWVVTGWISHGDDSGLLTLEFEQHGERLTPQVPPPSVPQAAPDAPVRETGGGDTHGTQEGAEGPWPTAISALRWLVALHDGPRGEDYEWYKPRAWQRARDVLAASRTADDERMTDLRAGLVERGYSPAGDVVYAALAAIDDKGRKHANQRDAHEQARSDVEALRTHLEQVEAQRVAAVEDARRADKARAGVQRIIDELTRERDYARAIAQERQTVLTRSTGELAGVREEYAALVESLTEVLDLDDDATVADDDVIVERVRELVAHELAAFHDVEALRELCQPEAIRCEAGKRALLAVSGVGHDSIAAVVEERDAYRQEVETLERHVDQRVRDLAEARQQITTMADEWRATEQALREARQEVERLRDGVAAIADKADVYTKIAEKQSAHQRAIPTAESELLAKLTDSMAVAMRDIAKVARALLANPAPDAGTS